MRIRVRAPINVTPNSFGVRRDGIHSGRTLFGGEALQFWTEKRYGKNVPYYGKLLPPYGRPLPSYGKILP